MEKHTILKDIGHGLSAGVLNVTPEQARKMLDKNINNRSLKPGKISQYTLDMEDGCWKLDGTPLIFNGDDKLIDGQHRLNAVIRSNISCEFVVIAGVNADSFKTIDTGANRSGGDVLNIYGLTIKKARDISSLIQRIHMQNNGWTSGWNPRAGSSGGDKNIKFRTRSTNRMVLDFYKINSSELDSVYEFCDQYRKQIKMILAFNVYMLGFYNLRKINVNDAELFFEKLATGESLTSENPIYHLREKLITLRRSETEKVPSWHYPALIYKSWNVYRKRGVMKNLFIRSTETKPVLPI